MKSQIPVRKGISKRICTTLYHANHLLLTVITFSFYQSPKLGITVPLMPIYNIIVNSPSPNSHLHAYTYQFDGMQWSKVETRFDTEAMAKGESSKDPEDDTDTKENGCVFKTEREVHFIMAAGISSRSLVKST